MFGTNLAAAAVVAASLLGSVKADVPNIVIKGSKFFYENNGTQFFIRGVAYQQDIGAGGEGVEPDPDSDQINDPLIDTTACKRDIPYLVGLRTNTIRVYSIDSTKNHDECMNALADAGIYVIADLSVPATSINRADPSWNDELYARYTGVIDAMANYSNTLGFFAGNEVSNNASNVDAVPFVKASVRDMKAYIKQKNYRAIGVGYAADDDESIRAPLRNYVNCGDQTDAVDFFGYNIYSWCGDSTYETSGYDDRTADFRNYSVPAFFAEYGCNKVEPRVWDETAALFGNKMTPTWSGGIAYQYFQSENNYGLVEISGGKVDPRADYSSLSSQMAKVTPSGVNSASYTPTNTAARACPTDGAFPGWVAATNLPPTPNKELCSCMVQNLTCTAKNSVNPKAYGTLFSAACDPENGDDICAGIARNGTTGDYGAYSMCSSQEQLAWAFDALYQQQARENSANTDACNFAGNATTKTPSLPSGCRALVDEAGSAGTGTVTSRPSGTGAGAAASSSSDAAMPLLIPSFNFGVLSVGAYVTVAMLAGAGMILL